MIGEKISATIEFDLPVKADDRYFGTGFEVSGRHVKYTEEFDASDILFDPEAEGAERDSMNRLATVLCQNSGCYRLFNKELDHEGEDPEFCLLYRDDYFLSEGEENVSVSCDTYEDFIIRGCDVAFMYESEDVDDAWEEAGWGDREEFYDNWPVKCVDAKRHIKVSLSENGRVLTRTDLVNGYYGNKYYKIYSDSLFEPAKAKEAFSLACRYDCAAALLERWDGDPSDGGGDIRDLDRAVEQNYVPALLAKADMIAYDENGEFKTRLPKAEMRKAFDLYDRAGKYGSAVGMYKSATAEKLCISAVNFEDAERRFARAAEMAEKEEDDYIAAKCYLSLACYDRDDSCGLVTTRFCNRATREPYVSKLKEKMEELKIYEASDLKERFLNLTMSRPARKDEGKGEDKGGK